MEETIEQNSETKTQSWKGIPVKPETFEEASALRDRNLFKSHDAFQKELLRVYRLYLAQKK